MGDPFFFFLSWILKMKFMGKTIQAYPFCYTVVVSSLSSSCSDMNHFIWFVQ